MITSSSTLGRGTKRVKNPLYLWERDEESKALFRERGKPETRASLKLQQRGTKKMLPIGAGSQLMAAQQKINQMANAMQLKGGVSLNVEGLGGVGGSMGLPDGGFQKVLMNTMQQVNQTVVKPDAMLESYMKGGPVDIHDLMIAGAASEMAVNMTSRTLTRVIQAYEKVSQIQL
jgi:flagellar hook-basal body complex protein FliE